MKNMIAEQQTTSRLFQLVEQLVRSSQPSLTKSHSCVVNDIPEDLLVHTDQEMLSTVISGMLGIAITNAKDSCIRISATMNSNMVNLDLRDYNRFNSYSSASGLRHMQTLVSRIGGTLALVSRRQGEKTIALSFPCRQDAA
ncbi:MAG: HAMP domain-containing histidine kinase [Chitinophagaceae bacterium]|nr:MAG: HAMP domain-containing histidine kinase [Chitinophagaceae bacterium]